MTPAERAALITQAKRDAQQLVSAVNAGSAHRVQRLTSDWDAQRWAAVGVVLARAASPLWLRLIAAEPDDGLPADVERARAAGHAA